MKYIVAGGLVVALALLAWRRDVGGFALLSVALLAMSGFWITNSHLSDWERELEQPQQPAAPRRAGRYERD